MLKACSREYTGAHSFLKVWRCVRRIATDSSFCNDGRPLHGRHLSVFIHCSDVLAFGLLVVTSKDVSFLCFCGQECSYFNALRRHHKQASLKIHGAWTKIKENLSRKIAEKARWEEEPRSTIPVYRKAASRLRQFKTAMTATNPKATPCSQTCVLSDSVSKTTSAAASKPNRIHMLRRENQ